MRQQTLARVFDQLFAAIDLCVKNKLRPPSLILLYSTIDIASWLNNDNNERVRVSFTKWVDTYVLPGSRLKCSSDELYGARCGLVHTYSPESDLSKSGRVTQLAYAWRPSRAEDLQEAVRLGQAMAKRLGQPSSYFLAIQVEDLIEACQRGVTKFLRDVEADTSRAAMIYARAGRFFIDLPPEKLTSMVQQGKWVLRQGEKVGRNELCPCGSGKKYKRCCGQ